MARYIDADALKEVIANNVYLVSDCINSRDYGMFWTGGIEKAIDDQPTADVMERKNGRWIKNKDRSLGGVFYECSYCHYECSCCKEMFALISSTPADNLYSFCPNCGADMRGAKK